MSHFFISYSKKNRDYARKLAAPIDLESAPPPLSDPPAAHRGGLVWLAAASALVIVALVVVPLLNGSLPTNTSQADSTSDISATTPQATQVSLRVPTRDLIALTTTPNAMLIATDLPTVPPTQSLPASFASAQFAFQTERDGDYEIYVMNADGSGVLNLTNNPANDQQPAWSPDGAQIVFISSRDNPENNVVYLMDADGSNPHRLFSDEVSGAVPSWSPDGTQILFTGYSIEGFQDIFVVNADGSDLRNLTNDPSADQKAAWSPDGAQIVFASDLDNNVDIYVMNADGTNVHNLTNDPAQDAYPNWSPTGSQIVFMSDRDGNYGIYAMDTDGTNLQVVTSAAVNGTFDGYNPAWSPDGAQIIFMSYRYANGGDLYVINTDGSSPTQIVGSPALEDYPAWRP